MQMQARSFAIMSVCGHCVALWSDGTTSLVVPLCLCCRCRCGHANRYEGPAIAAMIAVGSHIIAQKPQKSTASHVGICRNNSGHFSHHMLKTV